MDLVGPLYPSIAVETGRVSNTAQSPGIKPSTIGRPVMRLGVAVFECAPFEIRLTTAGVIAISAESWSAAGRSSPIRQKMKVGR